MIVTDRHRQIAREERERADSAPKKAMSDKAKAALGRGNCEDCGLPWDAVETGYHIAILDTLDWLCGFCYRGPAVREQYFKPSKKVSRRSLEYKQMVCSKRQKMAS